MTDAAADGASTESFRLMYRSRDRIPDDRRKVALGALFSTARSNNKARDITGALLVANGWFVQTLEGDEAAVRTLFTRIEDDPRHDEVTLLETCTVESRVFARWSMAKVAGDGEPDIPLIANTQGVTSAVSRGTTPEQESVLDVMRDATRDDASQT